MVFSNKLSTANSLSYTYDNNGNTTAEGTKAYTYNQNQRLIQIIDGSMSAGYTYNGNGQRVKKVVNGTTTVFHYNLSGQIIAESNSSGNITAEYVYLNGAPLAKIEGANTYFYHNDHLATPQKMTDAAGSVVWAADYKPFGEATITVSTITNNIGAPGEYRDAETGLLYNYFRDRNPANGRYVQADPIGIQRGKNHLYVYVGNNPVNWIDPVGLAACTVLFPDYPIDTGFGFTSTDLGGHGGILSYDADGSTSYYEYGRYSPTDPYVIGDKRPANEGNVRRVPIPDLEIDPKTGQPTPSSMDALRKALSDRAGHKTKTDLTCDKDADEKKVNKYAEDYAKNKKRPSYRWMPWSSNQCRDFANHAYGAGK